MNRNSTTALAAIESLEERLTLLLQHLDTTAGGQAALIGSQNASASLDTPGGEAGDLASQGSQLLERMEQIVLAAQSSAVANSAEGSTREELRTLSQLLERHFAKASEPSPVGERLLADWQAQLDRMEQQLESLREVIPGPARFE